jgi:hypothetical protein
MPVSLNNTQVVFNDASTQTTAGVTSVSAGTGISVAGGLTPTVTNTGVTSIVAGTGISISGGTGAVTVTNTVSGGVSSVDGQTGAVVTTNFCSIGGYVTCVNPNGASASTSRNSTIAGSSLRFPNTGAFQLNAFANASSNNTQNPSLTGTWRLLANIRNGDAGCGGVYGVAAGFWVRIS